MSLQKGGIRGLGKSFSFAVRGFGYCIKNERNMRIHLVLTLLVGLFCYFYKATQAECLAVFICVGFVMSSEMINTSIEALVNLESPSYNNLAKIAKDVAAGAVLVSALVAMIIAGVVFLQFERLLLAFVAIWSSIWGVAVFAVLLILGGIFVFRGPFVKGEKNIRIYQIRTRKK